MRTELAALRRLWAQVRFGGDTLLASRLLPPIQRIEESLNRLEKDLGVIAEGREQMGALVEVARVVNSSLDLDTVLSNVMDHIIRLTGAERAMLMLLDPETGELEFRAARNMDQETITDDTFQISRSIVYRVAREGQPILTTDALLDPRFQGQESIVSYSLRSILCVPLRVRERITGVIYADNRIRTGLFSDRDRDLLSAFADQAAVAIENARLFERVTAAKNLMDNVFTSIASGVITTDKEGRVTLINRSAEQILWCSAEQAIGLPYARAFPSLRSLLEPLVARIQRGRRPLVVQEIEAELPERGTAHLKVVLSPLQDPAQEEGGVTIVLEDLTEQRRLEAQERFIRETFQRYVCPAVVQRLLEDSTTLRLGGQRQEVSVLFADLRGFTSFSERCGPEELVGVLNQYLAIGADAVLAEEGTLDKFIGDAVMAVFNAPLPQPDHPLRAVRAALRIREAVKAHHLVNPSAQLYYGIGIAVGEAVVGNVGTSQQLNYTAIGACVNMAKRLEEQAGPGQILLSPGAYERVRDWVRVRPLPPISLDGFQEAVEVYELLDLK